MAISTTHVHSTLCQPRREMGRKQFFNEKFGLKVKLEMLLMIVQAGYAKREIYDGEIV